MGWYKLELLIRNELSAISGDYRKQRIADLLAAIAVFQEEE